MTQPIFVSADTRHLVIPYRSDIAALIPHAKPFDVRGVKSLLVPNGRDEARLCRNLGLAVPAPVLTRYPWDRLKRPAWEIQKTTAALLTESSRAYVLSTMGTGKTTAVLIAADYLLDRDPTLGPVLIAAPLSTLTPVWEQEIFTVFPQRRVKVLYGDRAKRLKLLGEPADVYVINHHGLHMLADHLVRKKFGIFVLDELAIFRNKSTQLWKAAERMVTAPHLRYAWGLTGSPTPNEPADAWAQVRLLTPARTTKTMAGFRTATMVQVSQFKWVPRPDANEQVFAAMQPSVRFTRDDVMELPETTYVDRAVRLDADALKAYHMLFSRMRMATVDGRNITAVNEGVLQGKLLQVACGYIYTDGKTVYELPATARRKALEEVLAETDRKVIVFVPYVHAIKGLTEYLTKHGHNVAAVYGATSRSVRDKTFTAFQNGPLPRILVAHPQTMAHGLTLTAANTIVWYGPTTSLEIYEQANARITRPGQTSKTLIVHLTGTPVERITYNRLKRKGKMQGALLELFKQQELDF